MASDKEYVVKLTVDTSGAVSGIEGVDDAMADTIKTSTSLKSQLLALKKELSGLDEGSKQYVELSRRAGELKDRIDDSAASIKANAGPAFAQLGNNAQLLKSRFLEMDLEGVGASFKGIAASVKNVKISDLTGQLKGAISGFAQLGKALLANPIFLIAAVIAAIIVNFKELGKLIDGVSGEQTELLAAQQKSAEASKQQLDNISAMENTLKRQGKTEKEILNLKLQALDTAILEQETAIGTQKIILDGQVKAAERNRGILKGMLDFLTLPLRALLSVIDEVGNAFGSDFGLVKGLDSLKDSTANLLFDPKQIKEEGEAAAAEQQKQLIALQNQRDGFILQEQAKNKAAAAEAQKSRDEELAAQRKQADAIYKITKELGEKILAEASKRGEDTRSKLLTDADAQFKIIEDQETLRLQLMADGAEKEIALADEKYIKLREQAHGNEQLLKELAEANGAEVAAIEKKYADERVANEKRVNDAKVSLAGSVLGAISAINESFAAKNKQQAKRQFEINKAVSIVSTLISTYQAAQQAYASQLTIPSPDAPVRGAIAAGAAILSGLAQVNKIRQTKFEGGDAGAGGGAPSVSSGGVGGGASGPPAFNPVNTDFLGNRPPQLTPAYVLAGNVTSAQEAREKVEAGARL